MPATRNSYTFKEGLMMAAKAIGVDRYLAAGAELLARIRDRLPDASPDKIATPYNSLAKDQVTDYGARVQQLMRDKPWERRDHTFDPFLKLRIPSP